MKKRSEHPETIDIPTWYKTGGGMMIRRDALPSSHPESEYGYIKNTLKLDPNIYGVYTDRQQYIRNELKHLTKAELIDKLADAKETIEAYERAGF